MKKTARSRSYFRFVEIRSRRFTSTRTSCATCPPKSPVSMVFPFWYPYWFVCFVPLHYSILIFFDILYVLAQNSFISLDPDIVMCRHLLTLDLSHNKLHDLPGPFAKLHSLNTLDVSNNRFSVFPQGIFNYKKEEERGGEDRDTLFYPQYLLLFVEICHLTNLQTLYVNRNQIPVIPAEVSRLQALRTLDFSCNLLPTFPPDLCKIKTLEL